MYFEIFTKNKLVSTLLHMGEALFKAGAEVYRIEDTLNRIGYAYGATNMNVFVITSSIVITIELPGDEHITQTRRLREGSSTDFHKLEKLNSLSREVCYHPIPLDELDKKVQDISKKKASRKETLIGYILGASAFSIFFGGSFYDALVAGLIGVLIWLMSLYLFPLCMNTLVYQFLSAFITGIIICFLAKFLFFINRDYIIIGDIMLLIPGIMFTNALRDLLLGDTISGSMRLVEAVLQTFFLCIGFIFAIWLIGIIL
ncbi:Uncharacterized membrane protein YjjP, DUF1212 family [Acetitomaculum ruminis DSM 5522]|uniref:Uncharacterized membrane protein YjjP, DUF1212 family n=1 Tax=Acetitomaculum ruminis DSM 5522 TaxID=1120918 RepID=A0A1I0WNM1_9FIRM|nr:threonine/serine exporter family protein [Acetitomaculum ruminis]SFA89770.1 Uncharacterized membrane protein YjjP, DUF1212 family [Acetitomaculum ruminis DSM 5522]